MTKIFKLLGNMTVLAVSTAVLLAVALTAMVMTLPDVGILEKCFTTTMYEVRLCPGTSDYVKLKSISPFMIHALIAAEDASFYSHKGFDWHEIQESFTANLLSGKIRRGGSTLTQQLAKNAFLSKEKSFWRKMKEAYLANAIENRYKKDFILEKYLNVVEFGPNIYGIKAASIHYFQKSPGELNPLEAAYLAHLLPNPKVYSKSHRTGTLTPFSRKMVAVILKRMASFKKLSAGGYETAMNNLNNFPWRGLGIGAFQGTPTWDLEAPHVPHDELDLSEDALEELIQESEKTFAPEPATNAAPDEEPSDME